MLQSLDRSTRNMTSGSSLRSEISRLFLEASKQAIAKHRFVQVSDAMREIQRKTLLADGDKSVSKETGAQACPGRKSNS